ncbi:MAG: type II secretion system F family protein [Pseudomonadota bacterium]|jgi:type II secretory pathway component PulF|nr:type II secretion system F family protein [Alphaproteobacteria bacterium]
MHFYQFDALKTSGGKTQGVIPAYSRDQALQDLKQKGLHPIRLRQKYLRFSNTGSLFWTINWARDMSFFLKQGLSLIESLNLSKLSLNKNQKQFIDIIINKLHAGLTLSQIFTNYPIFPKLFTALLSISEATGQYAQAFEDYSLIKQEEIDFLKKLRTSLQYPFILSLSLLIMLLLFNEFLLPVTLDFFAKNNFEQHSATRLFIQFAAFLKSALFFVSNISSLLIFFSGIYLISRIKKVRYLLSWLSTRYPIIGPIYLMSLQYFYLKSFSMLLKKGHHVIQAADYCSEALQNTYLKSKTQKIGYHIKLDGKISKALTKELKLSTTIEHLLLTGENTSQLPLYSDIGAQTLKNIYQFKLQKIIAWTGPILISIMGIIMIWMVIAFVLPLYDQVARME